MLNEMKHIYIRMCFIKPENKCKSCDFLCILRGSICCAQMATAFT